MSDKLSLRQAQALFLTIGFGLPTLWLPRTLGKLGGQNGWLLLLGAVPPALLVIGLALAACRGETDGFSSLCRRRLGGWATVFWSLLLWIKLLVMTGATLGVLCDLVQEQLLPQTSRWLVAILFLLAALYQAWQGRRPRGRLAELLSVLAFVPLAVVLGLACIGGKFGGLRPFSPPPLSSFLYGGVLALACFPGPELLLLLLPSLSTQKGAGKSLSLALLILLGFALAMNLLTLGNFGQTVVDKPWPTFEMLEGVQLPGAFIDRQEPLILWFWLATAYLFISAGLGLSAELAVGLGLPLQPSLIAATVISLVFCRLGLGEAALTLCGLAGIGIALILPLLLLFAKRKDRT